MSANSQKNEENLKELLEQFGDSEWAKQIEQDILKGEQILREHPAPEPDKMLIDDIKAEVKKAALARKTTTAKKTIYKAVAIAAVFIILAAIGVKLFERGNGEAERLVTAAIIPETIWESDDIAADDADLATLAAEIEQTEHDLRAVQLGENGGNGHRAVVDLEMKLIEINSDFWKG